MKLFSIFSTLVGAEFNSQPTGGVRPCEFYTFKAKAIFDHGFTENVEGALFPGTSKVKYIHLIFNYYKIFLSYKPNFLYLKLI